PRAEIGEGNHRAFGARLPFLLKVLAAAEPLSLQAHPNAEQARLGFEAEQRAGVPIGAPNRNYKDSSHKPELLCAVTPFVALCVFGPVQETLALLDELRVAELPAHREMLRESPDAAGMRRVFESLSTAPAKEQGAIVRAVLDACARPGGGFEAERR